MSSSIRLLRLSIFAGSAGFAFEEPRDIILNSATRDQRDIDLRKNYTYVFHQQEQELDSSGKVKSTKSESFDVTILYGRPYERLIEKDRKPLPPDREKKESEKMDKELARRQKESEKSRSKRLKEEQRDLEEQKEMGREVADAFHFQLLGSERIAGQEAWVIQAEPRRDYRPRSRPARILPKVRGKLWITKNDYRWVKVEAEVIDTFSFGLVLLRIHPGMKLTFEQTRVQDEVWMPQRAWLRGSARVALLKKINGEMLVTWDNYRKFQAESRVVSVAQEPQ